MDDIDVLDIVSVFVDEVIGNLSNFYRSNFKPFDNMSRLGIDVITDEGQFQSKSPVVVFSARLRRRQTNDNRIGISSIDPVGNPVSQELNISDPNFEEKLKELLRDGVEYGYKYLDS